MARWLLWIGLLLYSLLTAVAGNTWEDETQAQGIVTDTLNQYEQRHQGLEKYLVLHVDPTTGHGNRLQAAVSGLLLAVLTDRAFIINGESSENQEAHRVWLDVFDRSKTIPWSDVEMVKAAEESGGSTSTVHDWGAKSHLLNIGCASSARNFVGDDTVVNFRSSQYLAELVMEAKMCQQVDWCKKLTRLRNPFEELYSRLFVYNQKFLDDIARRRRRMGWADTDTVIGLQIRRQGGAQYLGEGGVSAFAQCGSHVATTQYGPNGTDLKFFVAADMNASVEEMESFFPNRTMRCLFERTHDSLNYDGQMSGLIDMALLSMCDNLILTPLSTFGAVPAFASGQDPWYITNLEGHVDLDSGSLVIPTCVRVAYTQPFCHKCLSIPELYSNPVCPLLGVPKRGMVALAARQDLRMSVLRTKQYIARDYFNNDLSKLETLIQIALVIVLAPMLWILTRACYPRLKRQLKGQEFQPL